MSEKCEGCGKSAKYHDKEGVPLCSNCYIACLEDGLKCVCDSYVKSIREMAIKEYGYSKEAAESIDSSWIEYAMEGMSCSEALKEDALINVN